MTFIDFVYLDSWKQKYFFGKPLPIGWLNHLKESTPYYRPLIRQLFFYLIVLSLSSAFSQSYWKPLARQSADPSLAFFEWDQAHFQQQNAVSLNNSKNRFLEVIELPNEKGLFERFSLQPAGVLSSAMAQKYPNIQTYTGMSRQRKGVSARITLTPKGVSAWIRNAEGESYFIQPEKNGQHLTYQRQENSFAGSFVCKTELETNIVRHKSNKQVNTIRKRNFGTLKTFRIAMAGTGEYTAYWGDNDDSNGTNQEDALAATVATLNRINEVFETDLGVHLELVTGADLMQLNAATDSFTGNYNQEAQAFFTEVVGEANYDVGHLLGYSSDADGNSGCIGCVCVDNQKGQGYTVHPFVSLNGPYKNDYFDLDFVGHELGHQFGAFHTFSHIDEQVGSSVEPGSGTTIMGYAGLVGVDNVQFHGDPYFHFKSIEAIRQIVDASNCATIESVSNTAPQIIPNLDYTLPIGTAYRLTAQASDTEQESLFYNWEQLDSGNIRSSDFGPQNRNGALARSIPPSVNPTRVLPNWNRVLDGELTEVNPMVGSDWETVPTVGRTITWGLTVRDHQAVATGEGALLSQDMMELYIADTAGPFRLLSQADTEEWKSGNPIWIRWDVANTNKAPVNTQSVTIQLSVDGEDDFTTTLLESTPNDGEALIVVPNGVVSSQARIQVVPVDNIYFAVNRGSIKLVAQGHDWQLDAYEAIICQLGTVTANYSLSYEGGNTELSFLSLPEGISGSFSNPSISESQASGELTLTITEAASPGRKEIIIQAQSGNVRSEFSFYVDVFTNELATPSPVFPTDEGTDVSPGVTLQWESNPEATSYSLQWNDTSDFSQSFHEIKTIEASISDLGLSPLTTYYWRVRSENACGESDFSLVQSFTTVAIACKSYVTENLPLDLQDATSSGIGITTAEVFVSDSNRIADLNVLVNIEHSYLQDLTIYLIAPNETVIELVDENGGEDNNYTNTLFDSEAEELINAGSAPFSGSYRPTGDLSELYGMVMYGSWQIRIIDNYLEDTGRLVSFELQACLNGEIQPNSDTDSWVDSMDNCPNVANEDQTDYDGDGVGDLCDLDGVNNFQITKYDTSCVNKNNGRIEIEAQADFTYRVAVLGPDGYENNRTFTANGLRLSNLSSGDYSLCITSPEDASFEVCYTASIGQPEPFSVSAKILANSEELHLNVTGADSYRVSLNNKTYTVTQKTQKRFPLEKGITTLKVMVLGSCATVYTQRLYLANKALVYPNPSKGQIKVIAGGNYPRARVQIYPVNGEIRYEALHRFDSTDREISLDVSGYSAGLYIIRLIHTEGEESLKLIVQ